MEKTKRWITFGQFNRKYCYFLLGTFIIKILELFLIIVFQLPEEPEDKNKFTILNILSYPFF